MERDNRLFAIIGLSLVLGIAVVTAVLWYGSTLTGERPRRPSVRVEPISAPTSTAPAPVAPAAAPGVEDSDDEVVRTLVAGLSSHPALARFLVSDRLLHRFVAAVDAVAGGYSPREELSFLRPVRPFLVREDDVQGLVIAAGSYHRYDLAAEVVASIDSRGAVALFQRLRDRLEEVHRQVSWSDDSFEDSLRGAVDHLLAVAIPPGQLAVERRTLTYAFADEALENLSAAQRQLLRMGPDNARTVQEKLRQLRAAFGWPPPPAPDERPAVAELRPPAGDVEATGSPAFAADQIGTLVSPPQTMDSDVSAAPSDSSATVVTPDP